MSSIRVGFVTTRPAKDSKWIKSFTDNAFRQNVSQIRVRRGFGTGQDDRDRPGESRAFDMVLAAGCVVREKIRGWALFCERLSVPPFSFRAGLPGYDQFEKLLKTSESMAFSRKRLLRCLNRVKKPGEPESKRVSAERLASQAEEMYRKRVRWWGG